jgi:hypothetical protein
MTAALLAEGGSVSMEHAVRQYEVVDNKRILTGSEKLREVICWQSLARHIRAARSIFAREFLDSFSTLLAKETRHQRIRV